MKDYKKVEMEAKNAPSGSYAAGCPSDHHMGNGEWDCRRCELTK